MAIPCHSCNINKNVPVIAPETKRIIRRVATKINKEFSLRGFRQPKAIELTGLHPHLLETLADEDTEELIINIKEIDRSVIYNQLMEIYLQSKIMPTTYQLFLKVYDKLPVYMDLGEFRNYLLKHGFMWKQIVKDIFVVIENPRVISERYFYLKNILRHRNEGANIYFIDEAVFDLRGNMLSPKECKSRKNEPQIGLICAISNDGVNFKQFVNGFSPETFIKWIKEVLLKSLYNPSVIVLNNYKHHCKELLPLPNENSLKKEMCDWLDYFDVPYDSDVPKMILFELIQKYTDVTQKMYVVDNLLRQNGHTVLRIPDCIIKLTPATFYFDILRAKMPDLQNEDPNAIQTLITHFIDTMNEEYSNGYSEVLAAEEMNILKKDKALDDVMDELEEFMKRGINKNDRGDSDLPSNESDSD